MSEQEVFNQQFNGDAENGAANAETSQNFAAENAETPVQTQPQTEPEAELFEHYEVKNWELSPRLYKIAAVSTIFNLLALFVFAQGSFLTMRGCDSPMVSKVCQVIDTIYIGSKMLGTDSEFVDKEYDPTDLGDMEVTYIDVSAVTPPLTYPEGYFALANPEEYAWRQQQEQMMNNGETPAGFVMPPSGSIAFPGIPKSSPGGSPSSTMSGGSVLNTTPKYPKPKNGSGIIGELPGSTSSSTGTTTAQDSGKTNRPSKGKNNLGKTAEDLNDETAENKEKPNETQTAGKTDPVTEVELNKRPLEDLGKFVNELIEKKEINLETNFTVSAKGKLNAEGKIDPKTFKYLKAESADPKMVEVVQESIEAINDSGYLQYLSELSGKDLNLLFSQSDTNIIAEVKSELVSETRAKSIESGLNLLISGFIMKKSGRDADANDKDDLALLKSAKVERNGKSIVIKFDIPKNVAQGLIQRKLLDKAKQQNKSDSTAENKANQNTAK